MTKSIPGSLISNRALNVKKIVCIHTFLDPFVLGECNNSDGRYILTCGVDHSIYGWHNKAKRSRREVMI